MNTTYWSVLRTKPQSDFIAANALGKEGYEYFQPKVVKPVRESKIKTVPMFPGYIFVKNANEPRFWACARTLPGILGWLRFDGMIPSLSDDLIQALKEKTESINKAGGTWRRFQSGQTVRVNSGKLESLAEILDPPKSRSSKIRVLLDFMGQMVTAEVSPSDVEPVSDDTIASFSMRGRRRTRGRGRWIKGMGLRQQPTT